MCKQVTFVFDPLSEVEADMVCGHSLRKSHAKSLEVEIPISLRSRGYFVEISSYNPSRDYLFLALKIAKASSGENKTISERGAKGAAHELHMHCLCEHIFSVV